MPTSRLHSVVPVALTVVLLLLPAPAGLAPHAWRYFAIFAGVVAALVLEPVPGGVAGLVGVVAVALSAPWTLYSPAELAQPGFRPEQAAAGWALSGFSNGTVWLVFAAFMFALGHEKTGLGRRLALLLVRGMGGHTLTLGYAIALTDLLLAPFTPSNTARSAGTIFPIVRQLPPLYGSFPHEPSARRIGSYLMWVAIATTSVTSSMFLTGLATNLLAVELVRKTTGFTLAWTEWFMAFLPVGLVLFAAVPLLAWWLYPPEVKSGRTVPDWAAQELAKLGPLTRAELVHTGLVLLALGLWVFAASAVNTTLAALFIVAAMLVGRVVTWDDVISNKAAWGTLAWLGTLVALADGLNRTGFVRWSAESIAGRLGGVEPRLAAAGLVVAFFTSHYLFASTTAHATALLPVVLAVGQGIPGLDQRTFALQLCLSLGLMGILTPYASGPSPVYYGSGYLPARDYWRLGTIFGAIFLTVYFALGWPWMAWIR